MSAPLNSRRTAPAPAPAFDPCEVNAAATWGALSPRLKVQLTDLAGVPAASEKSFRELTPDERAAMRDAATRMPELGANVWGVLQF